MKGCRRLFAFFATFLAVWLGFPASASGEEHRGKTEVMSAEVAPADVEPGAEESGEDPDALEEEDEAAEPGNEEILEVELTDEELWRLTNPWEGEGITVHDAGSDEGDSGIRTHGGGDRSGQEIKTHTQTSGEEQRIPVTRIGESSDDDIVVHGGGREGPSRIRVH